MTKINLIDIAQSWYQLATANGDIKRLMEKRLAICDTCPFKKQLNWLGELIVTKVNEEGSMYRCAKCTCPLSAKVARYENSCPVGRWPSEKPPQGYY